MATRDGDFWVVNDGIPLNREQVIHNYKEFQKRYTNPKEGYKDWRNQGFENYKNALTDASPTDFTTSTLTRDSNNNTWIGGNEKTDHTTFEEPTQFKQKRAVVKYAFYEKDGKWIPSYIGDLEYKEDGFDWEYYYDKYDDLNEIDPNTNKPRVARNKKAVTQHWLNTGQFENRDGEFPWEEYYDSNGDFAINGLERSKEAAYNHWVKRGRKEGRQLPGGKAGSDRITTREIKYQDLPEVEEVTPYQQSYPSHLWLKGTDEQNRNPHNSDLENPYVRDRYDTIQGDTNISLAEDAERAKAEGRGNETAAHEIVGEIELDLSSDDIRKELEVKKASPWTPRATPLKTLNELIYKELNSKIRKLGNTGNGEVAAHIKEHLKTNNVPVTFNVSINDTLDKALPTMSWGRGFEDNYVAKRVSWGGKQQKTLTRNNYGIWATNWHNTNNLYTVHRDINDEQLEESRGISEYVGQPIRALFKEEKGSDYILDIENEFRQKELDIVEPINEKSFKANKINEVKNKVYENIKNVADRTNSNEYLLSRDGGATRTGWNTESNKNELINAGMTEDEANAFMEDAIEKSWDPFYRNEKLNKWDANTAGAKLPDYVAGAPDNPSFDPLKYRMEILENEGPPPQDLDGNFIESSHPLSQWHVAEQKGDLDIIEKYGTTKNAEGKYLPDNYFHWHYTTVGKDKGYRGSAEKETTEATNYKENLDPHEIQMIRDAQLGVSIGDETSASLNERMLGIDNEGNPILDDNDNQIGSQTLRDAWRNAQNEEHDDYEEWQAYASKHFANINNPSDFVDLWRLVKADEEIDINLPDIQGGISGVSTLEQAISQVVGAQGAKEMTKFGGLSADILKSTTRQLQKQKAREEEMAMFSNIDGFSEIYNFNELFKNELMADSGVGGILALTGDKDQFEENLEGEISKLTGINNNVEYNWQKWFDSEFEKRYQLNPVLDNEGNPLEERVQDMDKDGNLLYEQLPVTDEEGNATYDDNGDAITVDDPTKPIYRKDKDGNYIKRLVFDDPTTDEDESRIYIDARDYDIYGNRKKDEEGNPLITRMELDKGYIDEYIRNYLTPRFNHSKSMNEFVDLINVRDADMNPFQTENKYATVTQLASELGEKRLSELKNEERNFDAEYYLDPTSKISREIGAKQKEIIANDRLNAASSPNELLDPSDPYSLTWAQAKYRYGMTNDDISDNEKWAKFHYDAKGIKWKERNSPIIDGTQYQGILFDPALDINNPTEIDNYIESNIQPLLGEQYQLALQHGEFGRFITPEAFADMMLKEAEAMSPEEWNKIKKALELDEDDDSTIDELRDMIEETIRGNEGHKIRAQIEYLNEKNKKPTQKLLGIDYIQRDEDYKPTSGTTNTELYNVFKNAGFQGDEDAFYNEFMPDADRGEQEFLTKALKGNLKLKEISNDPLTAFTMFDGFFDREDTEDTEEDIQKDIEERERLFGDEANYEANESTFFNDYVKKKSEFSDISNFFT